MRLEEKSGSIYIHDVSEKPLKIPSAMYPLPGEYIAIAKENTSPFDASAETDRIRQIFNSTQAQVGRCYSNAEMLQKSLTAANICAKTLVGWMFLGNTLPVMHCLTAVGNHILDFNVKEDLLIDENISKLPEEELRRIVSRKIRKLSSEPRSETCTFGSLNEQTLFIASYCSPQKGLQLAQKLRRAYPKHPAFLEVDSNGATHMQRLIMT